MASDSTLQERIDGIAYPPTHTYRLDDLKPTGDLAKRLSVIEREFPGFFDGHLLLDVGCNKGFFSLYFTGSVFGIDPVREYVDLCRDVYPLGRFECATFGKFETDILFDRIFIGNGPHYPFIEARGWGWVEKLARLSKGTVLLEGPVDMSGRDAQRCIPPEIAGQFNRAAMHKAFEPWFFVRKEVPSPLVDRFFTLLEKKDELIHAPMERYAEYLRTLYAMMCEFVHPGDTVMEICTRHDRGILGKAILPHREYIMVDRNPSRPGLNLDAVTDTLPAADVTISTAILHHTAPEQLKPLIGNIARNTRRTMIFTGPNREVLPELFGDHRYHLDAGEISEIAAGFGWKPIVSRGCGLSEPYCELFLVFGR